MLEVSLTGYGRGGSVGRGLGVGVDRPPVAVAVGVADPVTVAVGVGLWATVCSPKIASPDAVVNGVDGKLKTIVPVEISYSYTVPVK